MNLIYINRQTASSFFLPWSTWMKNVFPLELSSNKWGFVWISLTATVFPPPPTWTRVNIWLNLCRDQTLQLVLAKEKSVTPACRCVVELRFTAQVRASVQHTHTYTKRKVRAHTCTWMHTNMHTHIVQSCMHIQYSTNMPTHTNTNTHTHTQSSKLSNAYITALHHSVHDNTCFCINDSLSRPIRSQ